MSSSLARVVAAGGLFSVLVIGCASGGQPHGVAATTPPTNPVDTGKIDDPIQILQSRAPGLVVNRTSDGSISIRLLRGPSSVGNVEPLYIVDDSPYQPGPGGVLTGISPYDIASLRVLTRPEDIGVYGARGRNGVILVKTKRPGS